MTTKIEHYYIADSDDDWIDHDDMFDSISEKCSSVAPTRDSNTNPLPSRSRVSVGKCSNTAPKKEKEKDNEKKHWILTIDAKNWNCSNCSNIDEWVKQYCTTSIYQIEKGKETGFVHIQWTFSLKSKKRFSWIKNHCHNKAHIEAVRNIDAAFDYCAKSDTRIAGPFKYPAPIDDEATKDPLEGKELYEWQRKITEIIQSEPDDRKIYWIFDPEGRKGKSSFFKHLLLNQHIYGKMDMYQNAKKADIACAFKGARTQLFAFSRTIEQYISYDAIESVKDGMIFSSKYESGAKISNINHVICIANFQPNYETMTRDRWEVIEL